jgi:hypothetical protein
MTTSCAQHESLVDAAKPVDFRFSRLQPDLELLLDSFKVTNVTDSSIEQGDLTRLLVGGRKGVLEARVPFAKLITSPLFGFDALFPNSLSAGVGTVGGREGRLEFLIIVIGVIVTLAVASPLSPHSSTSRRDRQRVKAM